MKRSTLETSIAVIQHIQLTDIYLHWIICTDKNILHCALLVAILIDYYDMIIMTISSLYVLNNIWSLKKGTHVNFVDLVNSYQSKIKVCC